MVRRAGLSKAELEVARIIWNLEGATVRQVHDALPEDRQVDYKTIQTFMRRLELKGYLRVVERAKAFAICPGFVLATSCGKRSRISSPGSSTVKHSPWWNT